MEMKYEIPYHSLETGLLGIINIVIDCKNDKVEMEYSNPDGEVGRLNSNSCHDLLWVLDEVYKEQGYQILCLGLLDNVYPGGLTSDSTLDISAYQIDAIAELKRKVNIFDKIDIADIKDISSRENQRLIRENILKSYDVGKFSLEAANVNKGNEKVKNILGKYR